MNKIFGTLLLALFVVACAAPAQTPTGFVIIPATSTVVRPTATITPATTPTAQPTLALSPTPKPKPTQEPLKTTEHRAPNGWWSAQGWGEFRGETYHAELRVTRADGQVSWVASQDTNAGLGVPLPTPLEWSQDGRYLYYTNVPLVDGYTCSIPVNGSDLWRMDLSDGSALQLVPEVGLAVSLSPDEQTFAYVSFGPQQNLVLRDLATGEERRAPLPADTQAGGIVWSLDSSVMILLVAENPCSEKERLSILGVDAITLEQTDILIGDNVHWITLAWGPNGLNLQHDGESVDRWFPTVSELDERYILGIAPSPNQKWLALLLDRTSALVELAVMRADGNQIWTVAQSYPYDAGFAPLRWSPDDRYLYFTLIPSIDGSCQTWQTYGTNVQRLDVETGRVTELMRGDLRAMSISPNTKWLVHLEGKDLILLDLTTGVEGRVIIEALDAYTENDRVAVDYLTWSPDSQSIMLMVEVNSCYENELYSLVRVDRQTLSQTIVIQGTTQKYEILDWTDDGMVWLRDDNRNYWQLNPLTGELTLPTLVPQNLSPN